MYYSLTRGRKRGFTLLELLVVIAIVGLLTVVVVASFTSSREKSRDSKRAQDIIQLRTALELYKTDHGTYPSTGSLNNVYFEEGCIGNPPSVGDLKTSNWIPGLAPAYIPVLPQDPRPGQMACYMYSSNGTDYLLSSWKSVESGPQKSILYSRAGYRETHWNLQNPNYLCDHWNIGGYNQTFTSYNINNDSYAHSYTVFTGNCDWGNH